jgi:cytochrome c-type biogenesis protein CcmH/NrfG
VPVITQGNGPIIGEVLAEARRLADGGDPERAAAILARLLRSEPGHVQARYLLAVSHLRAGDTAAAEASFRSVIARQPQDYRAFHGLGLALERKGSKADAVDAFRTAAAINPGFEHARRKLAQHGVPPGYATVADPRLAAWVGPAAPARRFDRPPEESHASDGNGAPATPRRPG